MAKGKKRRIHGPFEVALCCAAAAIALATTVFLFNADGLDKGQVAVSLDATYVSLLGACLTVYIFLHTSGDASNEFVGQVLEDSRRWLLRLTFGGAIYLLATISVSAVGDGGTRPGDVELLGCDIRVLSSFGGVVAIKLSEAAIVLVALFGAALIVGMVLFIRRIVKYRDCAAEKAIEEMQRQERGWGRFPAGEGAAADRPGERDAGSTGLDGEFNKILADTAHLASALQLSRDSGKQFSDEALKAKARLVELERYRGASAYTGLHVAESAVEAARELWGRFAGGLMDGISVGDCDFSASDFEGADMQRASFLRCSFRGARLAGASAGRASFESCDFEGADMQGADFALCDFRESVLSGMRAADEAGLGPAGERILVDSKTSFRGVRFDGASLVEADFSFGQDGLYFDMSGCTFRHAALGSARFSHVDFSNCSFEDADAYGLSLREVRADNASLKGVSASACVVDKVEAGGMNGNGATFTRARFGDNVFRDSSFVGASFLGAEFEHVKIENSYCFSAVFQKAELSEECSFRQSMLSDSDFSGATLSSVDFSSTQLDRSLFRYCEGILECDFSHVVARDATFVGSRMEECGFKWANVSRTSFQGARMTGCSFEHANLEGCVFLASAVSQASFDHCRGLKDVDFSDAELDGVEFAVEEDEAEGLLRALRRAKKLERVSVNGEEVAGRERDA